MTTEAPGARTNQQNYNIMVDPGVKTNMSEEHKESLGDIGVKQLPLIEPLLVDDADDLETAVALANACKAKVNEILAALANTGIMDIEVPRPPVIP